MQDDIQIIREALAAGPTPGPWRWDSNGNEYVRAVDLRGTLLASCGGSDQGATNAAYMVACSPDRMERLLARLEDRERRVQELAGEVCALLLQLEAAP